MIDLHLHLDVWHNVNYSHIIHTWLFFVTHIFVRLRPVSRSPDITIFFTTTAENIHKTTAEDIRKNYQIKTTYFQFSASHGRSNTLPQHSDKFVPVFCTFETSKKT
jgi:hypothetical protein